MNGAARSLPNAAGSSNWHRGMLEADFAFMESVGCSLDNGTSSQRHWSDAMAGMPQYHARIDGELVHFAWIRGLQVSREQVAQAVSSLSDHAQDHWPGKIHDADSPILNEGPSASTTGTALMLVHGWPGSVLEYVPMARLLMKYSAQNEKSGAAPALVVDLVIPSLPRFGLGGSSSEASDRGAAEAPDGSAAPGVPTNRDRLGTGAHRLAAVLARLMCRLGYCMGGGSDIAPVQGGAVPTEEAAGRGYTVAGGDWGGIITPIMAQIDPCSVRMVHTALPVLIPRPTQLLRLTGGVFIDTLHGLHIEPNERPSIGQFMASLIDRSGLSKLLFMTP